MKTSKCLAVAILLAGVALGTVAEAASFSPSDTTATSIGSRTIEIDFRASSIWSSANPNSNNSVTRTYAKSVLGEGAGFFDIRVTASPSNYNLYWDSTDGFGVRDGQEVDEINSTEKILVQFFEQGTTTAWAAPLMGVYLTDLFDARNDGDYVNGVRQPEKANVTVNLQDSSSFTKTYSSQNLLGQSGNNGEYYGAFGTESNPGFWVYSVLFESSGKSLTTSTNDEFSVAGFLGWPVTVVPLPAALPLYGTGLAVMGFIGWRKRRKAAVA